MQVVTESPPDLVEEKIAESEAAADALSPRNESRTITFKFIHPDSRVASTYECVQGELGFLPANRFFTKVSREVKNFVDGEYGVKLSDLFKDGFSARAKLPELMDSGALDEAIDTNAQLINAFFKLVEVVPGFLTELIVLSLGIPDDHIERFARAIELAPHFGGLTQSEGFEILRTFIRQNAVGLRRFFEEEGKELVAEFELWVIHKGVAQVIEAKVSEKQEASQEDSTSTPGGKPSSTSPLGTPSE